MLRWELIYVCLALMGRITFMVKAEWKLRNSLDAHTETSLKFLCWYTDILCVCLCVCMHVHACICMCVRVLWNLHGGHRTTSSISPWLPLCLNRLPFCCYAGYGNITWFVDFWIWENGGAWKDFEGEQEGMGMV